MNLLIDTHLLLWAAFEPQRISGEGRRWMADPANSLHFSVASLWEVAIKRGLDRADFRTDPGVLRAGLLSSGYRELAVEGRHVLGLATLPALHRDPFDRLLIAQAAAEGMRLLTADHLVAAYGGPVLKV
ncbi:MAG: type II toxin-antitoxin system VapC family toxin [Paracoccus sp. (in: a-proteobacteria)]|nr:type II toxin-antitoxin system VapC family toxin [Paracoccus sp. (in: a-proteobacteria)]